MLKRVLNGLFTTAAGVVGLVAIMAAGIAIVVVLEFVLDLLPGGSVAVAIAFAVVWSSITNYVKGADQQLPFTRFLADNRLSIGLGAALGVYVLYGGYQFTVVRPALMIEQLCFYLDEIETARLLALDDMTAEPPAAFQTFTKPGQIMDDDTTWMFKNMIRICERNSPEREITLE